jgi:plasmid stabilization system protein ParE
MKFEWAIPARDDVRRLYNFLAQKNESAAAKVVRSLVDAPTTLLLNPRRGEIVVDYEPREVRRCIIGSYEMHYELKGDSLIILGFFARTAEMSDQVISKKAVLSVYTFFPYSQ